MPAGTVTFLLTDLEVSTDLWERHGDAMATAVRDHDTLIDEAVRSRGGVVFKRVGDGACAAFADAGAALLAALDVQRLLAERRWEGVGALRARMGIHTGPATPEGGDYLGPAVNRCARVSAAAHGGQVLCSAATEAVLERAPAGVVLRDLGEHLLRGIERPFRLFQVTAPGLTDEFPPPRTVVTGATGDGASLPRGRTRFVGRQRELAVLAEALVPGTLVTVTGMGGSGKTRLAFEAAADVADRFDAVHVVELAELSDPGRVIPQVAAAVGAAGPGGADPLVAAAGVLGTGDRLLVVDNCEHLVDACAAVVDELTQRCPDLAVLTTSREPLAVPGERVVRLSSLPSDDAVALFVDRAGAPAADRARVAEVCERLDGIPLAIELAAARLRHLTLDQLVERLGDRFRLLTGGTRGSIRRQQTLRATLDWSHDLLGPDEQAVLRRLAVFVGGFHLAAAERLCADALAEGDVLDVLGRLVDRSLVVFDDVAGRYSLLESVRDYAGEALVAAGEAVAVRDSHAAWAADELSVLVQLDSDPLYDVADAAEVVDFENFAAALEWSYEQGQLGIATRLAAHLLRPWAERGLLDEADRWLGLVAFPPEPVPSVRHERGVAAIAWTAMAALRNDFGEGYRRSLLVLDLIAAEGMDDLEVEALRATAINASVAVSIEECERLLRQAVDVADARGDGFGAARALGQLGAYRMGTGDLTDALQVLERGRACSEHLDRKPGGLAESATGLAIARLLVGDTDGARQALEHIEPGWGWNQPWWGGAATGLALVLAAEGDLVGARAMLERLLVHMRRLALPLGETTMLVLFGAVDVLADDVARGARLLGAARRSFGEEGAWRGPIIGGIYVQVTRRAREILGPEQAKAEREAGLAMTREEALDLALAAG